MLLAARLLRADARHRALPLAGLGAGARQATACLLCEGSASLRQRRVNKVSKASLWFWDRPGLWTDGRTNSSSGPLLPHHAMLSPGVPAPPSHPDIPARPVPSHPVSARHVPRAVVPALPVARRRDWRRPLPRLQCMNLTWALGPGPRAPPPSLPPAHWHNRHQCSSAHHRAHQHLTSRRTLPNRAFQGSKIPRLLRLRQPVATSLHHWSGQGRARAARATRARYSATAYLPPARPLFLPSSNAARRLISTARFTACNLFSHLALT